MMEVKTDNEQQTIPSPPLIPQLLPRIIILPIAPIPHHEIQRTRPAQDLASRPWQLPAIQVGLWYGLELPIILRTQRLSEAARYVDEWVIESCRSCLQNTDGYVGVLGQAGGDDQPCGSSADY